MRAVTRWIRGTLASRREGPPPDQTVLGAVLHSVSAKHVNVAVPVGAHGSERPITHMGVTIRGIKDERPVVSLFVGSITELNSGSTPLAAQPRSTGLPLAEDGMFIVDAKSGKVLETLPFVPPRTVPPTNGAVLHNIDSPRLAGVNGSGVGDNASHTLRQARLRVEELATANRRKDEFLAMLGHELRNPLASIRNALQLLRHQTQDTPAWQRTHAMIERQIGRMTQLVDDLLQVSRMTYGQLRLHCERIDLREVVNNAVETLESDIRQRNHSVTITLPDAPVWLQADPARLEQVFINLLANASRYTDTGGELVISMHVQANQAVVAVRDSGIGIAPEILPHIFELFRQADQGAPRSHSGLGIGLALVRDLVDSHGGSVVAASAGVGRGSEFTVRLPIEA
jgi:signal transduction histidine kinase